jgi:hypothetical protein
MEPTRKCYRCEREIRIEEPVYKLDSGGVLCLDCKEREAGPRVVFGYVNTRIR